MRVEFGLDEIRERDKRGTALEQVMTRIGDQHHACAAVEQLDANLRLELADVLADGGLRQLHGRCRTGQAAMVRHLAQRLDQFNIEHGGPPAAVSTGTEKGGLMPRE